MKKVTIVVDALEVGGAETFVFRFAAALISRGLLPSIFVLRGDLINQSFFNRADNVFSVIPVKFKFIKLILILDGLLYRLGFSYSLLRSLQVLKLRRYLFKVRPFIVHSHLITSDLVTARACEHLDIHWLTTMHGDYLEIEANTNNRAARVLDFKLAFSEIEKSVGHVVCISDQQIDQISRLMPTLVNSGRISKIYNGYSLLVDEKFIADVPVVLQQIPDDAFVIGMVARGIREKGWDVIIAAFEALALDDAWLILVGDGEYLQKIRDTSKNPRIIFCGNVVDPLRYVCRFDIACLPTFFSAESLPTVIIEYMCLGKPVIATACGEIPNMLDAGTSYNSGLLIELSEISKMTLQMQTALLKLYNNPAVRNELGENAKVSAKKFDMDFCLDSYLKVFQKTSCSVGDSR